MPENPYTRSAVISVVELVPEKGNLPRCVGWKKDGTQCIFTAKYEFNGEPVCGVHMGKPDLMFMPVKLRVGNGGRRQVG